MENFLKLFDLVGTLARRRYQLAEQHFSALGLNHTEARLLTLLSEENDLVTQDALSNKLFVDRSNAGRGLKSLEQRGYVKRAENKGDKRTRLVQITAKGRQTVLEISKLRKKMAQNFFGDLTEEDAGAIVELLQKVIGDEGRAARSKEFRDKTLEK